MYCRVIFNGGVIIGWFHCGYKASYLIISIDLKRTIILNRIQLLFKFEKPTCILIFIKTLDLVIGHHIPFCELGTLLKEIPYTKLKVHHGNYWIEFEISNCY